MIIVHKKRRNVSGLGSIKDLKEGCSNVKLTVSENEEMCCRKPEKVSQKEPQEMEDLVDFNCLFFLD